MNATVKKALIAGLETARAELTNRQYWLKKAVEGRGNAEAVLAAAREHELKEAEFCQRAADAVRDLELALKEEAKRDSKDR